MSELIFKNFGIEASELIDLTEEKAVELISKIENSVKAKITDSEDFYKTLDESKIPSDFRNKYLNEGTAKIAGMARKAIDKEFAISENDKASFSEEDLKNIERYVAKAKFIYSEKHSSGSKDVDLLQNENLSLKQKISEYDTQLKTLNQKFESDLAEKLTQKEIETLTLIETSKLQSKIVGQVGAMFKLVYPNIQSKYAIIIDNGIPSLRKKDNTSFKVEIDVNGKKEHLTIDKAIEQELKTIGVWRDEQETQQQKQTIVTDFSGKQKISDEISRKIAEENAFFGK
jgi:hypothetical protein